MKRLFQNRSSYCGIAATIAPPGLPCALKPLWTCRLYISQHPEVEAKIVQELREIGVCPSREGVPPRALTLADLPKLSYLQCVIKVRAIPA